MVNDGYVEPTIEQEPTYSTEQNTLKNQRKKDNKASFLIYQDLDKSTFEKIVEVTLSKQTWEILDTIFKGIDRVKIVVCKLWGFSHERRWKYFWLFHKVVCNY